MSLKKFSDLLSTLAFRLVLLYTGVFILSTVLAFLTCYLLVAAHLTRLTDEMLTAELQEFRQIYEDGGMAALHEELVLETETEDPRLTYFRVISLEGEVVDSTDVSSWQGLALNQEFLARIKGGSDVEIGTLNLPSKPYQVRYVYGKINEDMVFDFGLVLDEDEEFLSAFSRILIATGAVMALLSGLVGWLMSRRALIGVEDVTRTALEIRKGGMDKRVPLKSRGLEIETLAITFNEMIDHIEALIREMRDLTDNIAHDLRNPITAIRGRSELALTSDKPRDEMETAVAATVADCDGLLQMINSMLDLAEADSGALNLDLEEIDVSVLVADAAEVFQPRAEEKSIEITNEVQAGLKVNADRQGMKRIMANLLDNAIKYSSPHGKVTISARREKGRVEIAVIDSGPGIPDRELPLIFRRFYRGDKSRSERGAGLGLSLARAIARAHGGEISVKSESGGGSVFTISLPIS